MRGIRLTARGARPGIGSSAAILALVGLLFGGTGRPGPAHGNAAGPVDPVAARAPGDVGARGADTLHLIVPPRVSGWWIGPDLSLPGGESLIRQALYGQQEFERAFGQRSSVAWSPGAWRAAWSLPQILLGSGFDSFITGAVPWKTEPEYPYREFYWEGNDGSRIFTYRPFLLPTDLDPGELAAEFGSPAIRYYRELIALAGAGDPVSADTLEVLRGLADAESELSSAPVRFSAPAEAIEAVRLGIPADSVTVWRDELVMVRLDRPAERSGLDTRSHAARVDLQTAEAISAIVSGLPGGPAYPRDRFGRAWRQVLFHPSPGFPADSGAPAGISTAPAREDSAAVTIDLIIDRSFAVLRAQMDTRSEGGEAYVLFNPLGHARTGPALIEFSTPNPAGAPESASRNQGLVLVDVPEVPAYGAVAVPIASDGLPGIQESRLSPPSAGDNWIENAFLRVDVDPRTGAITRILDKANGRQALRPGGRANVLWVKDDIRADRGGPDSFTRGERQEVVRVLSLSASVSARAASITILRQWGSSTIRQDLLLGRTAPFLDVRTEVVWNEDDRRLSVEFEPVIAPSSATWEIPYGTMSRATAPETETARSDAVFPGQRWADVSAGGYGFSVLTAAGREWEVRGGTIELLLSRAWMPTPADRQHSPLTVRFAIYPHAGDWIEAGTHRLAAEYEVPLVAGIELPHQGRLGKSFSFLSTDHASVGLEWIKRAEDGDAFVIRLVEWAGEETEVEVSSACPKITARRANLLEDPGDRLPSNRGGFRIRLRPFEIATVLMECGG